MAPRRAIGPDRSRCVGWAVVCLLAGALSVPGSVAALEPSALDSSPRLLTDVAGRLFFVASDGRHGAELWRSDGTPAGTRLVKDIHPRRGAGIDHPVALGAQLLFTADDGVHGSELWRSDGTARGTQLVKDIASGKQGSDVHPAGVLGDTMLLWADDRVHGSELWRTDGTTAGTWLVRDIRPGAAGAEPGSPWGGAAVAGGLLHFGADDGRHGEEPWVSDATAAGTRLVRDLRPGTADSLTWGWTGSGDGVLFASNGRLWRSDGTAAGTGVIARTPSGPVSGQPEVLTAAGDAVWFFTDDLSGSAGTSLWRSDGTQHGTGVVRDGFRSIGWLADLDGRLAFAADDGRTGTEPWLSDGTAAGTGLARDVRPGPGDSIGGPPPARIDGRLLFAARDGRAGEELWITDGTPDGTELVKDIRPVGWSSIDGLTAVGDLVLFAADDGRHGQELWRSDGTAAGTWMVKDIHAVAPRARCTTAGGIVQARRATWAVDAPPADRVDLGRTVELCQLGGPDDDPGTRVYVDLDTLASERPTLAALAYLARIPAADVAGDDAASRYCGQLGGTTSFGDAAAGGWTAIDDPVDPVITLCVFADGSMIDAPALAAVATGVIRGADLSVLFAYQAIDRPAVYGP